MKQAAPYGDTNARCSRCGARVRVRVDTEWTGELVDLVDPCPTCAPRQSCIHLKPRPEAERILARRRDRQRVKIAAKRSGAPKPPIDRTCIGCGEPFLQPSKTGRPFMYCPSCRENE